MTTISTPTDNVSEPASGGTMEWLLTLTASVSLALRCRRDAERLMALSDRALRERGIERQDVLTHAFAPYFDRT